jgi:phosphate-selective porin
VGVRYSRWDAGDFTAANPAGTGVLAAGAANKASAWTLGLKWIPNANTRVYLNFVRTRFDTPVAVLDGATGDEKAITMRAAFSF